ncbi:MAG: hypothetical protein ACREI9_04645 [Nitrospiraceae bacterium]
MRIERVQYDGDGQWIDVVFSDGLRARLAIGVVHSLAELVTEVEENAVSVEVALEEEENT